MREKHSAMIGKSKRKDAAFRGDCSWVLQLEVRGLHYSADDMLFLMLGPQQMTRTTARVLLAGWCAGLLCGLGVLIYVIVVIAQLHASVRQTVAADRKSVV